MATAKVHSAPGARRWFSWLTFANPFQMRAHFQREAFLVLVSGVSLYVLICLSSFHASDTSILSAVAPRTKTLNLGGSLGAQICGFGLFAFGIGAFLVPLPFFLSALLNVIGKEKTSQVSRTLGQVLLFVASLTLLGLWDHYFQIDGVKVWAGGESGLYLANKASATLGSVGAYIILVTLLLVGLILSVKKSILNPAAMFMGKLRKSIPEISLPTGFMYTSNGEVKETSASPAIANLVMVNADPEPAVHLEPATILSQPSSIDSADSENSFAFHSTEEPRAITPYSPPPVSIFQKGGAAGSKISRSECDQISKLLEKTLLEFGVTGKVIDYQPGPVVTVYEFQPDAGIKLARVMGLMDDLALSLKVDSLIIHPVKGKTTLGIQVPNYQREMVYLGDIVAADPFRKAESPLTFAMGKSIAGEPIYSDLSTMPHLLAAGATGSGKSVAINTILCSLIMKAAPEDVRLILVDPKMLELSVYEGIPHLLMPVITEPTRASFALKWAAHEMEKRYKLMQLAAVRNITGFNQFLERCSQDRKEELAKLAGVPRVSKLPYIVLVIDELADLMMTAPKDVEGSIQRLAQKARASGIHLVLATQRPSVDIITGVIKANLPCRISFQVVSKHDSRTILDQVGSEKLLGKGDMLFQRPGTGRLERIHGAFISDEEVLQLVAAAKSKGQAVYDDDITSWIDDEIARQSPDGGSDDMTASEIEDDPKYSEAMNIGSTHGVVSASFLQRHLKIGYNRAARIVEYMESRGLCAKADGAKPRKWLGPTTTHGV